jgi:hypothetical protein
MLHEAIKRLDAGVLDGVELIANPKCHFNTRICRGLIADVAHLHVATLPMLAQFEVLNYALADLPLMKAQQISFFRQKMRHIRDQFAPPIFSRSAWRCK